MVNNFDVKKYITFIKKTNDLEIHEEPLNEFMDSLNIENKTEMRQRLLDGKYPIKGKRTRKINLSIEGADLDSIEKRMATSLGKNELGVLMKLPIYAKLLKEKGAILKIQGIGDLEVIRKIETEHPELIDIARKEVEKIIKKMEKKRIIPFGSEAIFANEENEISIQKLQKTLNLVRKNLIQSTKQQYRSQSIEKMARDERIQALEEKADAKLFRYIMQDALESEGFKTKEFEHIFNEWESHIEKPFQEYNILKEKGIAKAKKEVVTLKYLDKTEDIISCARIGDSAQDCFSSKNYVVNQNELGASDWIAMLHKDPLSFHFHLEKNNEVIGFVFGSYGIKEGKPVVMLNGVYVDSANNPKTILDNIEAMLSKPIGAKTQMVASRHGGARIMPEEYSNKTIEVKRLRALDYNRRPINQIYDDLGVGVNKLGETDSGVYWKDIN